MNFVRLIPVFVSFLLISAHFQRGGNSFLAVLCLLAPCLLLITRPWTIRVLQVMLYLSTVEWIRTMIHLVQMRQELELPWARLSVILCTVAAITFFSALSFFHPKIKRKYGVTTGQDSRDN